MNPDTQKMNLYDGFTLGTWRICPLEGCLTNGVETRHLQPKTMDVLLTLAHADGRVVERDDLLRQVWGERAVSDEPLTRCIGELRRQLGDTPSNPDFIMTIPKRGYRLLQSAVPTSTNEPGDHRPPVTDAQRTRRSCAIRRVIAGVAMLLVAAVAEVSVTTALSRFSESRQDPLVEATPYVNSIAILPFEDMSPAKDQEYMTDGMVEELLNVAASIHQLRVVSRTSVFSLKGQSIDTLTIANKFDVNYVLEGSIRQSGGVIRITAQLIDTRTDSHVWSATYDRELKDPLAIQIEVAKEVVSKLEETLFEIEPEQLAKL